MRSLKERIRLQEYEIGNDRALIAHDIALLKKTLGTPKYVGLAFLGGFGMGLLLTHPQTEKIKSQIADAPSFFNKLVSHAQFLLPIILG